MHDLSLSAPDITDRERELVLQVLSTPTLSGGPMVQRFEELAAAHAKRTYAVAVNSGTSGLHLIVRGLGLGPGDAVITTPFSFIASANCLLYEQVEPVFVDIEDETFNLDPEQVLALMRSRPALVDRIKAILAVDIFGQPAEWDRLDHIAQEYGFRLIEDSAEALGSTYRGSPAGSFGDASIFSFYPNKQITTGEGGVVLTDDPELAELCRSMRNQGRGPSSEWLEHVRLGYNYRLSELHSALGVAQLERLDEILQKRAQVANQYTERLCEVSYLTTPQSRPDIELGWFVYVIRLNNSACRAPLAEWLKDKGIPTRPYFPAIHLMPFYAQQFGYRPGDFPVTEAVAATTLALPFYTNMSEASVQYICDQIRSFSSSF